jgi:hypothetical protein
LKFKTNWKQDRTGEHKKREFCKNHDQISAFAARRTVKNRMKTEKLAVSFGLLIFFRTASDTHAADEYSQASNLVCLDV